MDSPVSERPTRPEICPNAGLEVWEESVVWPTESATGVSQNTVHAEAATRNAKRADLRSDPEFIALPNPVSYPSDHMDASGFPMQDELKTCALQEPGL